MNLDFQSLSTMLLSSKNQQVQLTQKADGSKVIVTNVDLASNTITYRVVRKGRPKFLTTNDISLFQ